MTKEELDGCLRMLEAYYPGEWDLDRISVWADVFTAYAAKEARAAIKAMAQAEKFPTVAAFMQAATNPPGVVSIGDRRFLPGSGWLGGLRDALEPTGTGDPVVVSMSKARSAIRRRTAVPGNPSSKDER